MIIYFKHCFVDKLVLGGKVKCQLGRLLGNISTWLRAFNVHVKFPDWPIRIGNSSEIPRTLT